MMSPTQPRRHQAHRPLPRQSLRMLRFRRALIRPGPRSSRRRSSALGPRHRHERLGRTGVAVGRRLRVDRGPVPQYRGTRLAYARVLSLQLQRTETSSRRARSRFGRKGAYFIRAPATTSSVITPRPTAVSSGRDRLKQKHAAAAAHLRRPSSSTATEPGSESSRSAVVTSRFAKRWINWPTRRAGGLLAGPGFPFVDEVRQFVDGHETLFRRRAEPRRAIAIAHRIETGVSPRRCTPCSRTAAFPSAPARRRSRSSQVGELNHAVDHQTTHPSLATAKK